MFALSTEEKLQYLVRLMIILLINPLHECAHAYSAYKLGDDTAKNEGRLTLSPLAHLDFFGSLLLFFFGFGWAKPVPVNPRNFKEPSKGMMLTAIAGPLSNVAAALLAVIAYQLLNGQEYFGIHDGMIYMSPQTKGYAMWMIYEFIVININLFLFNMIPVPPLDGSRVMTYLLPQKAAFWFIKNERYFYGAVMLLMMTGILSYPLYFLNTKVYDLLLLVTSWIPAVTA
ncbi:MAG TPA: site-2 protease family protein [Ruminococcus sp.]|nr:site-2 protease family protein [Ruminococcus sp.]